MKKPAGWLLYGEMSSDSPENQRKWAPVISLQPSDSSPEPEAGPQQQDLQPGGRHELRSYVGSERFIAELEHLLYSILVTYSKEHLYDCLHAWFVEMITNAIRANVKHLHFRATGVDTDDENLHRQALHDFKYSRSLRKWLVQYQDRLHDKGLYVQVEIEHSSEGLRLFVRNSLPITASQEQHIRRRMALAMTTRCLVDFYSKYSDDSEGEGLGFALNVLYLEAQNLDPALFRIAMEGSDTVARLEIPFSDRFRTIRRRADSDFALQK